MAVFTGTGGGWWLIPNRMGGQGLGSLPGIGFFVAACTQRVDPTYGPGSEDFIWQFFAAAQQDGSVARSRSADPH